MEKDSDLNKFEKRADKATEIIKKRRAEEVERYRLAANQPDEGDNNDNNA